MNNTNIDWALGDAYKCNKGWKQYRRCQAWTLYDGENIWIKSYSTIVAIINSAGVLTIRDHYSRTTSAQITKIYRSYKDGNLDR